MAHLTLEEMDFIDMMKNRGWTYVDPPDPAKDDAARIESRKEFLLQDKKTRPSWNGPDQTVHYVLRRDTSLLFTKYESGKGHRSLVYNKGTKQAYLYSGTLQAGNTDTKIVDVYFETKLYVEADKILGAAKVSTGGTTAYRPPDEARIKTVWDAVKDYGIS